MRWQEAKPGIERAACVMRPMRPIEGRIAAYVRAHKQDDGQYAIPTFRASRVLFEGNPVPSPGVLFRVNDNPRRSRIISALRVEYAVETQTFLDICADERLYVTFYEGVWCVGAEYKPSKSLRGAYLNYHAEVQS